MTDTSFMAEHVSSIDVLFYIVFATNKPKLMINRLFAINPKKTSVTKILMQIDTSKFSVDF